MERSEQEIEELLGWAQSSPEEAGREIMRLEDQIAELCQAVEAALNMVDGDGAPPRWDWMREVLAHARG